MPSIRNCERCQRPLDGVAGGGLCPVCLAALARAPWFDPEAPHAATIDLAPSTDSAPPVAAPEGLPSNLTDTSRPIGYFGDYELLEEIDRGGMGVIYRARQVSLDRLVAIKMIRAGVLASELDIVRFHAEARAAAGLRHPSIVAIHEVGEVEDRHYFSMEFVAGRNLAACVRERPWAGRRAARCLRAVAAAVDYAHHQGILHRDLKPSNVIIDEAGEPHLTDFGLATQIEGASALTLSGVILGTPSYMAPEQTGGRRSEIGPRTDVYALGAILYEMLTGRPPFQGESPLNTIQLVRDTEAVPLRRLNPRISVDLETLCLKCLEKDPRRRYATARDLADDLGRFLQDEPIRARPVRAWEHGWKWVRRNPWRAALAAASVVILLGMLGLVLQVAKRRELEALYDREKHLRRLAEDLKQASEEARASALVAASGERKAREEEASQRPADRGDWFGGASHLRRRRAYAWTLVHSAIFRGAVHGVNEPRLWPQGSPAPRVTFDGIRCSRSCHPHPRSDPP
jgi:hypothetical protein